MLSGTGLESNSSLKKEVNMWKDQKVMSCNILPMSDVLECTDRNGYGIVSYLTCVV